LGQDFEWQKDLLVKRGSKGCSAKTGAIWLEIAFETVHAAEEARSAISLLMFDDRPVIAVFGINSRRKQCTALLRTVEFQTRLTAVKS